MRRAPGRPKKQRIKANDEHRNPYKLPRQLKTVKCSRCGKLGHNKASCKGKTAADRIIPKGGNKKNKQVKQPDTTTTSRKRPKKQPVQESQGTSSSITGVQCVEGTVSNETATREMTATQGSQAPNGT